MGGTEIILEKGQKGKPLPHMWSRCIGAGRACEGLRSAWQQQLKLAVKECGFEYIRFHGLLAEDMFVYQEKEGRAFYNWYYIDQLYDFLMEIDIRPVVEFGFMPPGLASGETTQFWWRGNVTPPKDYKAWGDLIYALVQHWKERYGLDEIRNWYYEVWNEPNLHAFWDGTKSQYFELYRVTVEAVKAVDPKLRVGGPATSNFVPDGRFEGEVEDVSKHITNQVEDLNCLEWKGVWIEDFLNFCANEGLPVDFVSTHPYPTDFALDGQSEMKGRSRYKDSLYDDLTWLQKIVSESAYPSAELWLTEWSSSPTSRDYSHDYLPAADYIIKSNLDCAGMADCLSYWVFTDIFEEVGGGPECFHGGFGLMNVHGIRKPAYHAYRFLHRLGTEELGRGDGYIATKTATGDVKILLYNDTEELKEAVPIAKYPDYGAAERIQKLGSEKEVHIRLEGLEQQAEFQMERLDQIHSAANQWASLGYPENLTRAEEKLLLETVPETIRLYADECGVLKLDLVLSPWEIVLIEERSRT